MSRSHEKDDRLLPAAAAAAATTTADTSNTANLDTTSNSTPRPKHSSSSILQAFKNLTAGRPKALPSSPSTATSGSPPPSGYSNFSQLQRYSAATTATTTSTTATNGRSATDGSGSTSEFERIAAADLQFVGGNSQLQKQLRNLQEDQPPAVRAKAAHRIALLLKDYPVKNVAGLWTLGEHLIHAEDGSEEQEAAYELLLACVRYKTLVPQERRFFFDKIPREDNPRTFALRFKVLQEITSNGRYIACLESVVIPVIVRLLDHCFGQALHARKQKGVKQSHSLTEEHHLSQVYEYASDVIKFNSKMFNELDLRILIDQLLAICRKTAAESDLKKSIEIMDAIMTYSYIPDSRDLRDYLQVLCVVYCAIRPLKELAKKATLNLLRSHHGPSATTALLMILKPTANGAKIYRDAIKGSVLILHELLRSGKDEGLPPIDQRKLMSSVRKSLDIDSARLETCALRLLLFLLQDNDTNALMVNDKLWKSVSEVIVIACRRLKAEDRNQALAAMPPNILAIDFHTETEAGMDAIIISHQLVQCLAERLLPLTVDLDMDQKGRVMDLMMSVIQTLNDATAKQVIDFYATERLQLPSAPKWRDSCEFLYRDILLDKYRPSTVRILALQALHDAYNIGDVLGSPHANELIVSVLECIQTERDLHMAGFLAKIAADVAIWTSDQATFDVIIDRLQTALFSWSHETQTPNSPLVNAKDLPFARNVASGSVVHDSHGTYISKALVRIFLRAVHTSASKTDKVYSALLAIAGSNEPAPDARVICFKVLFRMRGDVNHGIFIVPSTESEGVAAALCRTAETIMNDPLHPQESPIIRAMNAEDHVARRRAAQAPLSRTSSTSNVRANSGSGRINRPTPPLWMYPGPKGLPEDPYRWASHLVFSHLDPTRSPALGNSPRITLKISSWLELLLEVLQADVEWEVFSYIIVHLGSQLMNHSLFVECVPQVRLLRNVICGQLASKSFHEPPAWTNLNRGDVAVCMYHILTILVSYKDHFTGGEQDDIVKMFVHGIGIWERASETCIHGLSVACLEIPVSVSKALDNILVKLSHIIVETHNAVHVLEFLSTLGRLPELYSGFQEYEFRSVFEILFQYLRSIRDTERSNSEPVRSPGTPKSRARDYVATASRIPRQNMEEHLPQYVFALSYHVMTFWFMSLSLEDRPKQMPWIIGNLTYRDARGNLTMDEQAQVTIDMMQRVAYSDRDETVAHESFSSVYDGKRNVQSWIVGLSILTIDTAGRTGASQIIRRRPSGTRYSIYRPTMIRPPRHQVPIAVGRSTTEDYFLTDDYVGIMPADVLQEFYAPQHISPTLSTIELPIPLPEDDATQRGLKTFDRISPLDGHKIGIIYVGEAQTTEQEVLSNVMGSADYIHFLRHIGTLTRLKDATFNTQGLDYIDDQDGQFTFCWRDRVSEIVFHVTTMMPTDLEADAMCVQKKRHVGNDFVNIIFNNSGGPYQFDTIASAFNYVNIVITPEARASFVETRLWARDQVARNQLEASQLTGAGHGPKIETQRDLEALSHVTDVSDNPYAKLNYKVSVVTAPGMPAISSASETKIVSGAALPAFVRLTALNASVFCHVWVNRESAGGTGEHVSSWRSRLRQINTLRDRHKPSSHMSFGDFSSLERAATGAAAGAGTGARYLNNHGSNGSASSPVTAAAETSSGRPTVDTKRESGMFRRSSLANIFSTGGMVSPALQPVNGQSSSTPGGGGGPGDRTSWFSNTDLGDKASSNGSAM